MYIMNFILGMENNSYSYMGSYNQHDLQTPTKNYQDSARSAAPYAG